jgi:hypothetical protein
MQLCVLPSSAPCTRVAVCVRLCVRERVRGASSAASGRAPRRASRDAVAAEPYGVRWRGRVPRRAARAVRRGAAGGAAARGRAPGRRPQRLRADNKHERCAPAVAATSFSSRGRRQRGVGALTLLRSCARAGPYRRPAGTTGSGPPRPAGGAPYTPRPYTPGSGPPRPPLGGSSAPYGGAPRTPGRFQRRDTGPPPPLMNQNIRCAKRARLAPPHTPRASATSCLAACAALAHAPPFSSQRQRGDCAPHRRGEGDDGRVHARGGAQGG